MSDTYTPRVESRSRFIQARGLRHHVRSWGNPALPPLVMMHGWMDVSASFQFVVDCFARERHVIAPDWRGFGLTERTREACYWFPDYLADLEALLDEMLPGQTIDLVGHSMGANVSMLFAGVRPDRIRKLVNLESFGLPATDPSQAPGRLREFLDELKQAPRLRDYASLAEVAERLRKTNPRLDAAKAAWLAQHWAAQTASGRFELLGDPAHKVVNPYLWRVDESMAVWSEITAPVLLVGAMDDTRWKRYETSDEFKHRLSVVKQLQVVGMPDAGHMVHHDQPARVAELIEAFIDG